MAWLGIKNITQEVVILNLMSPIQCFLRFSTIEHTSLYPDLTYTMAYSGLVIVPGWSPSDGIHLIGLQPLTSIGSYRYFDPAPGPDYQLSPNAADKPSLIGSKLLYRLFSSYHGSEPFFLDGTPHNFSTPVWKGFMCSLFVFCLFFIDRI